MSCRSLRGPLLPKKRKKKTKEKKEKKKSKKEAGSESSSRSDSDDDQSKKKKEKGKEGVELETSSVKLVDDSKPEKKKKEKIKELSDIEEAEKEKKKKKERKAKVVGDEPTDTKDDEKPKKKKSKDDPDKKSKKKVPKDEKKKKKSEESDEEDAKKEKKVKKKLARSDDAEDKTTEGPPLTVHEQTVALLRAFITEGEKRGNAVTPQEVAAELRRVSLVRSLTDEDRARALVAAVLADAIAKPAVINEVVVRASPHLALLVNSVDKAQASLSSRAGSKLLFSVLEDLCVNVQPKLAALMPHMLKALYEHEVLEDDSILAWFDSSSQSARFVPPNDAARLKTKAKPFVDWLRQSEPSKTEVTEPTEAT